MILNKRVRGKGGGINGSLRFLSVLGLLGVLIFAGVVVTDQGDESDAAVGDQFTVGELIYEVTAEGEVEVADTTSSTISSNIEIPSSVSNGMESFTVTAIGGSAFERTSGMTSISIPDTVTTIGAGAFYYSGLTSISIPGSVTTIDGSAFERCNRLTTVVFNGATAIGDYAFRECFHLTSVILDGVTSIGDYAFTGCYGLTSITIPDSVTSIGSGAFSYCSGLTSITIAEGVTSIGSSAFSYCSELTSITIAEGVTSIGDAAFMECSALTSVTFESETAPTFGMFSFVTGTTINVYTPGWDPTQVMTGDVITSPVPDQIPSSTVVWANPSYPDLIFESNPEADGIVAWVSNRP